MHDAEAIVVGGGPAGSTFAAALAQAGHRVLLLDKSRFPRHKACSDYISPAGVSLLGEMGVLDDARCHGARPMEGMIVHAPDGSCFPVNYGQAGAGQAALGLSRYHLDNLLLQRAQASGVTIREGAHVRDVLRDNGRAVGAAVTIDGIRQEIRAPLIVGADGRNSVVARALQLDRDVRWPRKTGLAAHYHNVTGLDQFGEMHTAPRIYAGLALLEHGLTNVTIVARSHDVKARNGSISEFFSEAIQKMPGVAQKLNGAERIGGIRGVGPMACRSRRTTGDGYLLIGDAAAFLDPFVGEGVYEALRSGLLAAPVASAALKAGDVSGGMLDAYRRARRREFTGKRTVSWLIQGFINNPPLMNYVTRRLAQREELGSALTGVLGGLQPARHALSPLFLARLLRP